MAHLTRTGLSEFLSDKLGAGVFSGLLLKRLGVEIKRHGGDEAVADKTTNLPDMARTAPEEAAKARRDMLYEMRKLAGWIADRQQGLGPEDAVPLPVEPWLELVDRLEQRGRPGGNVSEMEAITAVVRNPKYDLNTKAALIAHLHDMYTVPDAGLRQLQSWNGNNGKVQLDWPQPVVLPRRAQFNNRVLLFVHGTFSCAESVLNRFHPRLRRAIDQTYATVLAWDHPTLSVSPRVNGKELAERLQGYLFTWPGAEVDIICHSRGGLVTRELVERQLGDNPGRLIKRVHFVATPNAGTHFASPENIFHFQNDFRLAFKLVDLISSKLFGDVMGPLLATLDDPNDIYKVLRVIPGLAAQTPNSAYVAGLNGGSFTVPAENMPVYSAACADVHPDAAQDRTPSTLDLVRHLYEIWQARNDPEEKKQAMASLHNSIMDAVFALSPNDNVVDTESVLKVRYPSSPPLLNPSRVLAYVERGRLDTLRSTRGNFLDSVGKVIDRGNVDHSGFFLEEEWAAHVIDQLQLSE